MSTRTREKGKTYGEKVAAELAKREAAGHPQVPSTNKAAVASREKRAKRVMYPGLGLNAAGNREVKLKEWPEDFDESTHLPLTKKDFENEAPFLEHRAEKAERLARALREQAAMARKYGNAADRAKAKRYVQMRDTMKKIEDDLRAQGIDVDALSEEAPKVEAKVEQ